MNNVYFLMYKDISILINIQMDFAYLLVREGGEWEDMVIIVTKEEAIQASLKYPNSRVEIFLKSNKFGSVYEPSYDYYENGILIEHL